MRLGELRSKTRDLDNKLIVRLSNYEDGTTKDIEIDIATENFLYIRVVE